MKPHPMGFHPSEQEKIAYLLHKVNGKPTPSHDDFISLPTIDIYGKKEPWEIFDESDDKEIYFFTRFKYYGQENVRLSGKGTWFIYGNRSTIFDSNGEEIGFLKKFIYRRFDGDDLHNDDFDGKWLLDEYTLADKFKNCVKEDYRDYIFCSLKQNPKFVSDVRDRRTQGFFYHMLVQNFMPSSSSSSSRKNKRDRSPSLDLELRLGRG